MLQVILAESGVFVPGWLLVVVAGLGLVGMGMTIGSWIERVIDFGKVRREMKNVIDKMDGQQSSQS